MADSLHVPQFITSKDKNDLIKRLLQIQSAQWGKVKILTIYYDSSTKEHVLWYYPIKPYNQVSGI